MPGRFHSSSYNKNWHLEASTAIKTQIDYLLTTRDLRNLIEKLIADFFLPILSVKVEIVPSAGFEPINILVGSSSSRPDAQKTNIPLDDFHSLLHISIWLQPASGDFQQHITEFESVLISLASCFWLGDSRDKMTHLLSGTVSNFEDLVNRYFRRNLGKKLIFIFSDLDNFKDVNNKIDHHAGDRVLLEASAIYFNVVGDRGIPIRRSGDEFIIISDQMDELEALQLCQLIQASFSAHDFNVNGIPVGVTMGIFVSGKENSLVTFDSLEPIAEQATKCQKTGEKLRGKVRFYIPEDDITKKYAVSNISSVDIKRGVCAVKSLIGEKTPFSNPWLNLFSNKVFSELCAQSNLAAVQVLINQLLSWVSPEYQSFSRIGSYGSDVKDYSSDLSKLDILLAIAHGIYRWMLISNKDETFAIKYNPLNYDSLSICDSNSSDIFEFSQSDSFEILDIGSAYTTKISDITGLSSKRGLLLKIGYGDSIGCENLFAGIIVVDDKPVVGGSLPDFWESALANIISKFSENVNIKSLFVYGDVNSAPKTIEKLSNVSEWKESSLDLSYKTGMDIKLITMVAGKLNGNLHLCANPVQLVEQLYRSVIVGHEIQCATESSSKDSPKRFLNRAVQLDGFKLSESDGCSVSTIAEAFPVVVDIVRNSPSAILIRDQTTKELKELTDFKIRLKNPAIEKIPAFYQNDADSFNDYFRKAFIDDDSLFGCRLNRDNQLEDFLRHIKDTIFGDISNVTTRRAILVVPNERNESGQWAPLGLVSIRAVPRYFSGRITIDFSFLWRTVEVLVGFPYSIYGSVRFAENLVERISSQIPPDLLQRNISLGEITYIANSLHISDDAYGQNIARRIVDEACI